jgi:hypothetical protein
MEGSGLADGLLAGTVSPPGLAMTGIAFFIELTLGAKLTQAGPGE